jgi:hypothetical protein
LLEAEFFEGEDRRLRHVGWRIGGSNGRGKLDCLSTVFCQPRESGNDNVDVDDR